jgi:hypothetical protein
MDLIKKKGSPKQKEGPSSGCPNYRQKYWFLIYNCSLCLYNIMRDYFREGYLQHFRDPVRLVKELLQENVGQEFDWLGRFTWVLFNCSLDSGDLPQSLDLLNNLWDNSSKQKYEPCMGINL